MHIRIAALAFILMAGSAWAQEPGVDCDEAVTQLDLNACAQQDFESADAELNAVWKDARAAAKETDAEQSPDLKGADEALLGAQRAWLVYRDNQCRLAGFDARGGSMEPMLVWRCMAALTEARTLELRTFADPDLQLETEPE